MFEMIKLFFQNLWARFMNYWFPPSEKKEPEKERNTHQQLSQALPPSSDGSMEEEAASSIVVEPEGDKVPVVLAISRLKAREDGYAPNDNSDVAYRELIENLYYLYEGKEPSDEIMSQLMDAWLNNPITIDDAEHAADEYADAEYAADEYAADAYRNTNLIIKFFKEIFMKTLYPKGYLRGSGGGNGGVYYHDPIDLKPVLSINYGNMGIHSQYIPTEKTQAAYKAFIRETLEDIDIALDEEIINQLVIKWQEHPFKNDFLIQQDVYEEKSLLQNQFKQHVLVPYLGRDVSTYLEPLVKLTYFRAHWTKISEENLQKIIEALPEERSIQAIEDVVGQYRQSKSNTNPPFAYY